MFLRNQKSVSEVLLSSRLNEVTGLLAVSGQVARTIYDICDERISSSFSIPAIYLDPF
jgi:hypothetical protein